MRAYAIAAIEKDRAERSEAVPVVGECRTEVDGRVVRTTTYKLAAPPERSDVQGAEREALREYANELNWDVDAQGIRRVWREPGSSTPDAYEGFELARSALASRPAVQQDGWLPLTDEDRDRAFQTLPDMLDGFIKKWGWLHYAKAIEEECRVKNSQPAPTGEKP